MQTTRARGVRRFAWGLLIGSICACGSRVTSDEPPVIDRRVDTVNEAEPNAPSRDTRADSVEAQPPPKQDAVESPASDPRSREDDDRGRNDAADAGDVPEARNPGEPDEAFLVPATGPCPEFRAGRATFMPDGRARAVEISMSDRANDADGALVFTWFATAGTPAQALGWLGQAVVSAIEEEGGIIVAPYADQPSSTRPWYNTPGGPGEGDQDLRLMDEVIACARESVGVDVRRIHAIGMSAGGLQTTQVAFRRSGYLASAAIYSGGLPDDVVPPDQDPDNKFAAMVLFGGATDISPVDGIAYLEATNRLVELLGEQDRFVLRCDHGGGHSVPAGAQQSVWQFFTDHPYGTQPSPYASGIPNGFVAYCEPQ
jgi:predicted esterase